MDTRKRKKWYKNISLCIRLFNNSFRCIYIAFIYNEIIVCNFCGLNQNTWKAIDQKAYDDWLGRDTRDSFDIDGDYIVENNGNEKDDNMVEMN